jgi:ubiquinone biosynthesis protein UbiJ
MGQVQVRTATRIMENGTQLSQSFHRHVLAPADDLTNEDAKVVAIANATWTTDVVSAYEAMIANQIKEII